MVICKFKVWKKAETEGHNGINPITVTLTPVQGEPFGQYTPSGHIEMVIQNQAAADQFIIGNEYTVEFNPVLKEK